jgi:F-type H+-transporting ATPase subunit b
MEEGGLLANPEFWVAVGIAIFLGLLAWQKVPAMITKALDDRAAGIAKELEEATRLREDAQLLLAQYKSKRDQAEKEAASILSEAKAEAERFSTEMRASLTAQIERRGKQAQEKIAQAEAQAVAEVRALAADAAIAAAEKLIALKLDDKGAADLIKRGISEIPAKLN